MGFKVAQVGPILTGQTVEMFSDASQYSFVGASATTQQVSVSGKAIGDYLECVIINPLSTAAGAVSIFDGTTAIVSQMAAVTGNVTFVPYSLYVGVVAQSTKGFNVTTGANITVTCVGRFGGAVG